MESPKYPWHSAARLEQKGSKFSAVFSPLWQVTPCDHILSDVPLFSYRAYVPLTLTNKISVCAINDVSKNSLQKKCCVKLVQFSYW